MGGSLAAALSSTQACRQVVGIARRRSTLTTALDLRFIHRGTADVQEGVREADIVILATPVRDILARIKALGPILKPGSLLTGYRQHQEGDLCRLWAHCRPTCSRWAGTRCVAKRPRA